MSWKHEDIETDVGILRITGDTTRILVMVPPGEVLRWNGIGFRFHGCWNVFEGRIGELESWMLGPGPVEGMKGQSETLDDRSATDAMLFVENTAQEWLDDAQSKLMLADNVLLSPPLKEDPEQIRREMGSKVISITPEHAEDNPYEVMDAISSLVELNQRYLRATGTALTDSDTVVPKP